MKWSDRHVTSAQYQATGAVILGGAHGSLAVARSLGRRGIPVWFVTHDNPIAKYSRYVTRSFKWAGPHENGAIEWLVDLATRHGLDRWVLFASGDREVRLVAQNHAALAQAFRSTTPPWSTAKVASDKRLTYQHARAVDVHTPWNFCPTGRDDMPALDCRFPLIIKPTYFHSRNAFTAAKAWRVDDRAELLRRYDAAAALVGPDAIMLQELIPGGGEAQFSYAAVWKDGAPVASLVARRRRQYPIHFGFTSTYVETMNEPAIEEAAIRYLAALRYSGLVELEFKRDIRDGRYKLLDFNPRPWTWIALGTLAGVDFSWLQWRLALGETVAPMRGRTGCGWTHASRDIVSAVQQMIGGTLTPREYLRSWHRNLTFAAYAADDPLPALVDLPVVMGRVLQRRYIERAMPPQIDRGERAMPAA